MESPLSQNKKSNGDSLYVEGVMKLVLRCCRGVGIAPLLTTHSDGEAGATGGWRVVLSPKLAALQAVVMTLINVAATAGVILDLYQMPENRIRVGSSVLKTFIWVVDLFLMMLIASDAVYSAPAQMRCLKRVLAHLQQIKLDLNIGPPCSRTEKIKTITVVLLLSFVSFVSMVDFSSFVRKSAKRGTLSIIMPLYSPFYIANVQEVLVVMRWWLTTQAVCSGAAAVNLHLQWLLKANLKPEPILALHDVGSTDCQTLEDFIKQNMSMSTSKAVKIGSECSTYPSQVQAIVHRLALSYERASEMIKQMNDSHGLILMAILMTTFFRLVLTPYYMFAHLFHDEQYAVLKIVLPLGWSLILTANLIMTIEPCHLTHVQRRRTRVLLSQLIVHMAPKCQRVSNVLDQFAKQIMLSDDKFMPLGVYVLSRPLMAMMLGSVTTYLLILIQFEAISKHL